MSWSFVLNLLLCLFGLRQAWLDHGETFTQYRTALPHEKRKKREALFLLWGVPIISIGLLPFTWSDNAEIGKLSKAVEEMDPKKAPVSSVSALVKFRVKGDVHIDPGFNAGLAFMQATNVVESKDAFNLQAGAANVSVFNVLPISQHPDERDVVITFNEGPLFEQHFFKRWNNERKAEYFDSVLSFVIAFWPEMGTNVIVQSGTVQLTVNSSLSWKYPIPRQRQKFGLMTCKMKKNSKGEMEGEVMPSNVGNVTGANVGFFDGK